MSSYVPVCVGEGGVVTVEGSEVEGVPTGSVMREKGGTRSGEMRKDSQMKNQFQAVFDSHLLIQNIFSNHMCFQCI